VSAGLCSGPICSAASSRRTRTTARAGISSGARPGPHACGALGSAWAAPRRRAAEAARLLTARLRQRRPHPLAIPPRGGGLLWERRPTASRSASARSPRGRHYGARSRARCADRQDHLSGRRSRGASGRRAASNLVLDALGPALGPTSRPLTVSTVGGAAEPGAATTGARQHLAMSALSFRAPCARRPPRRHRTRLHHLLSTCVLATGAMEPRPGLGGGRRC